MENETIIKWIIIFISISLFIIKIFYHKINIRDNYKKITIFTLIFILYLLMISQNNFIIKEKILEWNYLLFLLFIPIFVLIGFIIFNIIKLFLGKIDIEVFWKNFTSWEKLNWEIKLKLNRSIKCYNLYIYLRWYQYIYNSTSWTNSSWKWKKKYEDKITLEENYSFESNYNKNYNFSFDIPYNKKEWKEALNLLEKEYNKENLSNEQKEKALNFANSILKFAWANSWEDYLKLWKIEVRLEKKWIDLFNQKKVNIIRKLKESEDNELPPKK